MTRALGSLVSNKEAEALKEMIFKRATERAQSIEADINQSYTTSAQNDIMDLARNSFIATKNPFSIIESPEKKEEAKKQAEKEEEGIGFPQRRENQVKNRIEEKSKEENEKYSERLVLDAMIDARVDLSKKTSFMGALNFLNSQASIALINQRYRRFEATA